MTATVFRGGKDLAPHEPSSADDREPQPGDVLRVPTDALRDLDPALVDDPATPPVSGPAPVELVALLDELARAGSAPRSAPGRGGSLIPVPAVAQLRAARALLRQASLPAALVAHTAAVAMPHESGQWPAGRADTGIRCAALYLAWRTGGDRHLVASVPGDWPPIPPEVWATAVRTLLSAVTEPEGALAPAEQVEYVAWRLGTALAAVELAANPREAVRVGAALALYWAWRDELALAEQRRRLAEYDARIDAQPVDPWAPIGGGGEAR